MIVADDAPEADDADGDDGAEDAAAGGDHDGDIIMTVLRL